MIPNMDRDSSGDESDDVIPPTPMFKSTPLYSSVRARKRSSSSESSADHQQAPLSHPPLNAEADDSSSEDETTRLTAVKREGYSSADSSSSSEDEKLQEGASQAVTISSQNRPVRRPVHSMSSSDSENSENGRSPPKGQLRRDGEDSDDENEISRVNANRGSNFPVRTKVENANSENEADTDSSEDTPGPSTKQVIPSSAHDSGESEELTEPQNTRGGDESNMSSSDESEKETKTPLNCKPPAESSSDESLDEALNPKFLQNHAARSNGDSSEESSEEDVNAASTKGPAISANNAPSDDSSDEDEASDVSAKKYVPPSNLNKSYTKTTQEPSEESSEEDEDPALTPTPASIRRQASSDSSDDNEAPQQTTKVTIPPHTTKKDTKSDEDSSDESDEEGRNSAPQTLPATSLSHQAPTDSSDEDETSVKARTDNNQDNSDNETSDADPSDEKCSPLKSLGSQTLSRTVSIEPPLMRKDQKMGISLLDETFQGSGQLQVDDAPLCREDIGSDDEIWLVQCPKFMNISALKKGHINLSAEKDIQLADGATFKRFSVIPESGLKTSINCLLPSKTDGTFLMSCLPVQGKVVINEHVHVPKLKIPAASTTGPVPFPSGLKVRHPLLGAGFEKHIAEAKIALQEASYSSKKKKKDKKRDRSGYDSFQNLSDDSFHNSVITPSSKSNGTFEKISSKGKRYANSSYEEISAKKRKKMSLSEKETQNESPFADHIHLNGSDKKKHKKSKKDVTDEKRSEFERRSNDIGNKPSWHTPQIDDTPVSVVNFESGPVSKKIKKSKVEPSKLLSLSGVKQERDNSLYLNGFDKEQSSESSFSKKRKRKEKDDSENKTFDEDGSLLKPSKKRKT